MKKYLLAAAIASSALLGLSAAQAAPISLDGATIQSQVSSADAVQKVWHCRRWSGGWGCRRHHW